MRPNGSKNTSQNPVPRRTAKCYPFLSIIYYPFRALPYTLLLPNRQQNILLLGAASHSSDSDCDGVVVSGVPSGLPGLAEVDPAVLVLILGFPPRDPDGPEDHVGSGLERGARKKGPSQTRLWTLLSRGRTLIWRASGPSNP